MQSLQKENANLKEQLTKSKQVLVSTGKINVGSVIAGDTVMVIWNDDKNNFLIYTDPCFDQPLHFLHEESTHLLGLTMPPSNESKRYCFHQIFWLNTHLLITFSNQIYHNILLLLDNAVHWMC